MWKHRAIVMGVLISKREETTTDMFMNNYNYAVDNVKYQIRADSRKVNRFIFLIRRNTFL